jgi:hypothetical protein
VLGSKPAIQHPAQRYSCALAKLDPCYQLSGLSAGGRCTIDHTQYHFGLLRDWMHFCEQVQDVTEVEFQDQLLDAKYVDEIQHAVRLLATALNIHADALSLANPWLTQQGRWRLATDPSAVYQQQRRPED